ncbi:MAG: DUF2800 domain-containing protein [Bacteroidales bacterium]|nr:DUF2800 domain-containing protein [Bacteroidales bacterium]
MADKSKTEGKTEGKADARTGSGARSEPLAGNVAGLETLDHSCRAHAVLSASSSKQWLNCPPSARLQEQFPNESSVFAEEGTFMHEVCEYKVRHGYLHERMKKPQSAEFYTEEVEQVTDVYAEFVISVIEEMKANGCEPIVLVEERLDYSHLAPGGFGTGDMLVIGKDEDGRGLLHVMDFKGGKGVFVDADHNTQMMLYGLGALRAYGYIYDIETVRMTIIQPRLDNISTYECTREELEAWGESIRPIAKMAYEGKGEQKAGDWCRFCRAKPVCRACAEEALSLCREEFLDLDAGAFADDGQEARASPDEEESDMTAPYRPDNTIPTFKQPGLIPLSELAEILPTLNRIASWIEAVFAYVSAEAIGNGVPVPGYKVVEGRSKRVFSDTDAVVRTALENGYTDLYKRQLISLSEFEKMMGKKKFAELLGEFVVKPPGKLALVPDSDPRPAVDLTNTPDQEFEALTDQED